MENQDSKFKWISAVCNISTVILTVIITIFAYQGLETWKIQTTYNEKIKILEGISLKSRKLSLLLSKFSPEIVKIRLNMEGEITFNKIKGTVITDEDLLRHNIKYGESLANEIGELSSKLWEIYSELELLINKAVLINLVEDNNLTLYEKRYFEQLRQIWAVVAMCFVQKQNIHDNFSRNAIANFENLGPIEFSLEAQSTNQKIQSYVAKKITLLSGIDLKIKQGKIRHLPLIPEIVEGKEGEDFDKSVGK